MPKVLIVLTDLRAGNGTASTIMSYYAALIDNGYEVDFLFTNKIQSKWDKVINKNGGIVYYLEKSKLKFGSKVMNSIVYALTKKEYNIIHVNIVGAYAAQILALASSYRIKCRIWHSHSTIYFRKHTDPHDVFNNICDKICLKNANYFIACSNIAGKSRFKNKGFAILKNCVDADKFRFNKEARNDLRKKYQIGSSTLVVGTVARMSEEKNPFFSLRVFQALRKIKSDAIFVWVGDGPMKAKILSYVKDMELEKSVFLVGVQSNVAEWYSLMDCFLLPSFFEGFPVVCTEAQTSGLNIYASTMVPEETVFSPYMHRIDLENDIDCWTDLIFKTIANNRREDGYYYTVKSGYDIGLQKNRLTEIYDEALNNYS